MRALLAASVVVAVVFALTVPASATTINWDGSGSPATAGYATGYSGTHGDDAWSFNTPSTGVMTKATSSWSTWKQTISDISSSAGYTVSFSVDDAGGTDNGACMFAVGNPNGNSGNGLGVQMVFTDSQICFRDDNWSLVSGAPVVTNPGGFNVVTLSQAPGGGDVSITINGSSYGSIAPFQDGQHGSIEFGSNNDGGVGTVWDYVNVGPAPTPEPSAIILLVTALLGLLCYAWRKRKCVPS